MRIIKPAEIWGEIISLINEADKELVAISPSLSCKDPELFASIKKAIERGVNLTFFLAKGDQPGCLLKLNVRVHYVEELHSTIYLSEKKAISTFADFNKSCSYSSINFGFETENFEEFYDVKKMYLSLFQKEELRQTCYKKRGFVKEDFKHQLEVTCNDDNTSTNTHFKKLQLFEARFQKVFRRHNLIYSRGKNLINCDFFPFEWTNFQYNGMIKISFLSSSTFDYKKLRKESISEFNNLFSNHKAYWSYPYDIIRLYGNNAANGIDSNDINAEINYHCWLIGEVVKFLEPKEHILLNTSLYRLQEGNLQ